jgi:ATP-dependent DNA helicase RecQ
LKKDPGDLSALANRLIARFQKREEADLDRLRKVMSLAETPGCLTVSLVAHFGETMPPCGHCDRCRGVPVRPVPRSIPSAPTEEDWAVLRELIRSRPSALGTARQLARFLCGLSSPATTREKLTRHDAFGLFAHLPFAEVLAIAEAQ